MTRLVRTAIVAVCIPTTAIAQQVIGSLSANVDGAAKTWYVTQDNGESQSRAMTIMPDLFSVTLWGNPTADSNAQVNGALVLDFMVLIRGGDAQPKESTLQWLEDGYTAGYLALNESALSVTLTKAEETETGFAVEGTFNAVAQYSDQIMLQMTDPTRTIAVDGRFSADLPLQ